ncbi:hypothetical protein AVEN_123427-1 [Araneus ventricosus]|uniref:Uncharacterized protein n=1 Tax=Araneus ventricosus TaxID=182803 RepID=A0A4Y2T810_ARAVE|nr:hypothetical protein AVEN_123427-1 [Araneus ventricosus]
MHAKVQSHFDFGIHGHFEVVKKDVMSQHSVKPVIHERSSPRKSILYQLLQVLLPSLFIYGPAVQMDRWITKLVGYPNWLDIQIGWISKLVVYPNWLDIQTSAPHRFKF